MIFFFRYRKIRWVCEPRFRRAFMYIHFPVLCGPSLYQQGKNPAKLPLQFYLRPSFIAFFNFSHKRPTFAFTPEIEYTQRIAHKGLHAGARPFPPPTAVWLCAANRIASNRTAVASLRCVFYCFTMDSSSFGCLIVLDSSSTYTTRS